jgi:hypothetical protein
MNKMVTQNQKKRLLLAIFLLIGIGVLLSSQDEPRKSHIKLKKELSPKDILLKASPLLSPLYIKSQSLPALVIFRNEMWVRSYSLNSSNHLMTELYYQLSERIPGKPRFDKDDYVTTGLNKSGSANYSKEKSLVYLEFLYLLTGDEEYLSLLMEASNDLVSELESSNSFMDHPALRNDEVSPYILRMLGFRTSKSEEDVLSVKLYAYLEDVLKKNSGDNAGIQNQCEFLWSSVPLVKKKEEFRALLKDYSLTLYKNFLSTRNTNRDSFKNLSGVIACLDSFLDLEEEYGLDVQAAYEAAFDNYVRDTFNYPRLSSCPPSAGFFSRPLSMNSDCRDFTMTLSENVYMNYFLYKYIER